MAPWITPRSRVLLARTDRNRVVSHPLVSIEGNTLTSMSKATTDEVQIADTGPFRPIQYLGSKWRLLDEIERQVAPMRSLTRPVICDLFAGTGVVANRLAQAGPVLAVDVQEYSRVLTSAQFRPYPLSNHDVERFVVSVSAAADELRSTQVNRLVSFEDQLLADSRDPEALCDLVDNGSIAAWSWSGGQQRSAEGHGQLLTDASIALHDSPYSVMTEHYGGVYFSYEQAINLDAMCLNAHALPDAMRDTVLAAVLSTASELVSSVGGHFAQPIRLRNPDGTAKSRPLEALRRARQVSARDTLRRWMIRWGGVAPAPYASEAVKDDFVSVVQKLPERIGVVYADPPYTREHYSRFYHVLETLALGDEPGLSTVRVGGVEAPSRGLYRRERHQSPFSIVSSAPLAFGALCEALVARDVPLVLSYSPVPQTDKPRARVMTMGGLLSVLGNWYGKVDVLPIDGVGHARLNAKRLNTPTSYDAEVLIICRS